MGFEKPSVRIQEALPGGDQICLIGYLRKESSVFLWKRYRSGWAIPWESAPIGAPKGSFPDESWDAD